MIKKLLINIKSYFPSNGHKWKKYFLTSIPIIFSAMIFALNAFVDNFMSTNIEGGNQALSYANSWTEIEIGIISLTTIVGSILFAQYVGKKDFAKVKEVINFRILFALFIALIFAIPSLITPSGMVDLISGFDYEMIPVVKNNAVIYLRLIAISWIFNAIWFTLSMILREKHHGSASFISSLISLVINIVLNSIFTYGFHFGIDFLAYSTIISNVISLSFVIIFICLRDREILINPLKIFFISKHIIFQFIQRILSFLLLTIGSLAVTVRFIFWNIGYPTGSIGLSNYALSAANILGITGMFFNIFWTAFESINANVAIYVGKELGSNNFEVAKIQAKELQGFHLVLATIMGLLLFACSFAIQEMTFLAKGYQEGLKNYLESKNITNPNIINDATSLFMLNLKYTLWPLCLFMPMFIWFITRSRIISSGGHTNHVAAVEAIAGILQLGWLSLVTLVFNKNNSLSFPLAYFIFFLSDVPKLIIYEILIKKVDWVRNITHEQVEINH